MTRTDTLRPSTRKTFLSYSRRQLYFAESLALHLQNGGLEIWFDLQKLTPGTAWSEGLTEGVEAADRLILVVSKAALESPWTRREWEAVVDRGQELILVLYEPVNLPEKLRGFPTYDFRRGFSKKLAQLLAFLRGEAEPLHDRVPAPGRLGFRFLAPPAVHLTLLSLFLPVFTTLLAVLGPFDSAEAGPFWGTLFWGSFWLSIVLGIRYAAPFWRHTIGYGTLKRGMLVSLLLWLLICLTVVLLLKPDELLGGALVPGVGLVGLYVYFRTLRRSPDVLRWLRPQDSLQKLRRRVHGPLFSQSGPPPDVDLEDDPKRVTYTIHADAADRPLARHLEKIFEEAGLTRVDDSAAPRHHVALLTNRTSEAEAQRLATDYGGNVIFIVASTIEFRGSLKDVGSYQWVDFRDGDRRDLETLARSLRDPESARQASALEVTPDRIDRWKVPGAVTLQKRFLQIYGGWLLIFGLTDLLSVPLAILLRESLDDTDLARSVTITLAGGVLLWLTTRGLVYRKVPALALYGLLLAVIVVTTRVYSVFPAFLTEHPIRLALVLAVPIVLASLPVARYWFPAFARVNADEVGIRESIRKRLVRRQAIVVGLVVILILGSVALFYASRAGAVGIPEPDRPFDLHIRGGTVVDGSGAAGRLSDVLIRGERIVWVGPVEPGSIEARRSGHRLSGCEEPARGIMGIAGQLDHPPLQDSIRCAEGAAP